MKPNMLLCGHALCIAESSAVNPDYLGVVAGAEAEDDEDPPLKLDPLIIG